MNWEIWEVDCTDDVSVSNCVLASVWRMEGQGQVLGAILASTCNHQIGVDFIVTVITRIAEISWTYRQV